MNATSQSTKLKVGEMTIQLHAAGCEFDSATAWDFAVLVDFSYAPGEEGRGLFMSLECADDGVPAELNITAIRAASRINFLAELGVSVRIEPGHDITALFTRHQIDAFEEQLLAEAKN